MTTAVTSLTTGRETVRDGESRGACFECFGGGGASVIELSQCKFENGGGKLWIVSGEPGRLEKRGRASRRKRNLYLAKSLFAAKGARTGRTDTH